MIKVLFFAATALTFTSCSNNQETTDKANQSKIDSMSQEFVKRQIIDSMNSANAMNGAAATELTVPVIESHRSSSSQRGHNNNRAANPQNSSPVGSTPVASTPPAVSNRVTGPTAAEIAAKKKEDQKKTLKSTAIGAGIGAGAGAIGGAIAGKNDHFKKEDAAIGAGIGAVVGAGAGFLIQKRKLKKEKDSAKH